MTDLKMKVYIDTEPVFVVGWNTNSASPEYIRKSAHDVLDSELDRYLSEEEK